MRQGLGIAVPRPVHSEGRSPRKSSGLHRISIISGLACLIKLKRIGSWREHLLMSGCPFISISVSSHRRTLSDGIPSPSGKAPGGEDI